MEKVEIELKFSLKDLERVKNILDRSANFIGESHQKDTYFIPAHRNFIKQTPVYEWLRVREFEKEGKKFANLNYKDFGKDRKEDSISCNELETIFEDPIILKKIFQNLDISELISVDKKEEIIATRKF